jgi:hypothetical protein
MVEYVLNAWRPEVAAASSGSLARCVDRLGNLVEAERAALLG